MGAHGRAHERRVCDRLSHVQVRGSMCGMHHAITRFGQRGWPERNANVPHLWSLPPHWKPSDDLDRALPDIVGLALHRIYTGDAAYYADRPRHATYAIEFTHHDVDRVARWLLMTTWTHVFTAVRCRFPAPDDDPDVLAERLRRLVGARFAIQSADWAIDFDDLTIVHVDPRAYARSIDDAHPAAAVATRTPC